MGIKASTTDALIPTFQIQFALIDQQTFGMI